MISYANQDRAYVDRLAGHMRACSINPWLYEPEVNKGAMLIDPLEQALWTASALVVLMSPHSHASWAVGNEVEIAMARHLRILPILLEGRPLPILEHIPYFDATSGELPSEKVLKESGLPGW